MPKHSGCQTDSTSRHSQQRDICVASDAWNGQYAKKSQTSGLISMILDMTDKTCSAMSQTMFIDYNATCQNSNDVANAFMRTQPLTFTLTVSAIDYDVIRVSSFIPSGWLMSMGYYFIGYYQGVDTNWNLMNLADNTNRPCYSATTPCDLRLPANLPVTPTKYSFSLTGVDYFSTVVPTSVEYTVTMPTAPSMTTMAMDGRTTRTITVSYNATGGLGPSTYVFNYTLNGVPYSDTNCIRNTTCKFMGLDPNTNYTISVGVASGSKFSSSSQTMTIATLVAVSLPNFTPTYGADGRLNITFRTKGGDINSPFYFVTRLNGTMMCNSTEKLCSIPNLTKGITYNVSVSASNEGTVVEIWKLVDISGVLLPPRIIITPSTASAIIQYIADGGNTSVTTYYNVSINGNPVQTNTSLNRYDATGLEPDTTYTVKVSANKPDDQLITSNTASFTTLKTVQAPTITLVQNISSNSISVYYNTSGGSGSNTYTVSANGTAIPSCILITSTYCELKNPALGQYYQIDVKVDSDGFSKTSSKGIMIYLYPSRTLFRPLVTTESTIQASWTQSNGGVPNETYYTVSISLNSVTWSDVCVKTQDLTCSIQNLLPNKLHYLRLTLTNTFFNPLYANSNGSTLPEKINYCLDRQGGTCSSHGNCTDNICVCDNEWKGSYCEERITIQNVNNGTIENSPNTPAINITSKGVYFSFAINEIIERDSTNALVKSVNVSSLMWFMVNAANTTVTAPVTNDTVLESRWTYNTSVPNITDSIVVTFLQYQRIEGVTRNTNMMFEFANQLFTIDLGSLKYNVAINKWRFASYLNTLEIHSTVSRINGGSCDQLINGHLLNSGPVSTINITDSSGNNIVGRFINRVVLDETPRVLNLYTVDNLDNMTIVAVSPAFSDRLEMDPDFGFLVRGDGSAPSSCNPATDQGWKLITGVVVGGIAFVAIVIAVTVVFLNKKGVYIKHTFLRMGKIFKNK
ncbi:hypothetical protein SAMD00019534_034030 [Acytostelium subglobosum LB1]|uniref:hypothetical protein n=1 Tax=Acytostelium subglobosum LB1 TaxID=1410327 RepID=UPI00064518BA|nr:hypothetical protein SAMD00019534_034030 [Acytostelium subglobosum LB1]GAM20228.1 hypothetical protein SAMD00019534_034030 [Acytostelium subglobosum LB1]|eukprot:XP_012759749.1 hypothetical protein SAMD00019534_034030 [Acytostelium subglobosum LB1]